MLLPDGIYKRVPQFWLLIGVLFIFLGMSGGEDLEFFPAYLLCGLFCILRSVWIYKARWKYHRRNQVAILKSTQIINHSRDLKD